MPKNVGDIFGAGVRILLTAPNEPLRGNAGPVAYLHFVDGNGDTIVPTYEPDGLSTPAGPVSGAKYTLGDGASLAALEARVAALEATLDGTGTATFERVITKYLSGAPELPTRSLTIQVPGALAQTYQDAIKLTWDTTAEAPAIKLGFFGGTPVVQQTIPNVSVLADDEAALEASNLIERLP